MEDGIVHDPVVVLPNNIGDTNGSELFHSDDINATKHEFIEEHGCDDYVKNNEVVPELFGDNAITTNKHEIAMHEADALGNIVINTKNAEIEMNETDLDALVEANSNDNSIELLVDERKQLDDNAINTNKHEIAKQDADVLIRNDENVRNVDGVENAEKNETNLSIVW